MMTHRLRRVFVLWAAAALWAALGSGELRAQTSFVWTNAAGSWATNGNWTNFPPVGSGAPLAGGSNDYVLSFLRAGSYAATNNLAAPSFTLNRLVFSNAAVTLAGSNLVFAAAGTGGALPQILQNSATAVVINAGITLGTNLTFGGVGGGTMTVGGAVSGAGTLTKTSTNTLVLNGTNTHVGNFLVAGGTLQALGEAALGASANSITLSNAILRGTSIFTLGASRTVTLMAGTTGTLNNLVLDQPTHLAGSGRLQVSGNGVVLSLLTNQVNYTGDTLMIVGSSGTAYLRSPLSVVSNYHLIINAGVYEGVGPTTFTWTNAPGGGPGTFESMVSGVAGWSAYNGRMVVNLGGATGQAYLANQPGLYVGNNSGMILGGPNANDVTEFVNPLNVGSGRTLTVYDNPATNTDLGIISGALSGGGTVTKDQNGTLWLTATSAHTGGLILRVGALRANDGVGLNTNELLTISGGVLEGDGAGSFTRGLGTGANQVDYRGGGGFSAYGGKLTVNLAGGIPLAWSNATGYTAWFITNGAVLAFGSATADSEVEFQNALDLNGGARTVTVTDNLFASGDFARLSGTVSNGALVKAGTGVLVLGNPDNGYAGGTTNSAGTLALAADHVLGLGPLVMAGGGLSSFDTTARSVTNPVVIAANAFFGLAGSGDLTLTNVSLTGNRTIAVSNGVTTILGPLTNAFGLTKDGPGRLVLAQASLSNLAFAATGGAGTLEVQSGTNSGNFAGTGSGAAGNLVMTGPGTLMYVTNGSFRLGGQNNQWLFSNGAQMVYVKAGSGDFGINYSAGNTNDSLVFAGGAVFVSTNSPTTPLYVGIDGVGGRLAILSGSKLYSTNALYIGNSGVGSYGHSVLVSDPGSYATGANVNVGNGVALSQYVVSNGAQAFSAQVYVGLALAVATNNLILVTDTGSWTMAGLTLGQSLASSFNQASVSRGGQLLAGSLTLGNTAGSTGNQVFVQSGGQLAVSGSANIGASATSLGNLVVVSNAGSLFSVGGVLNVANSAGSGDELRVLDGGVATSASAILGIGSAGAPDNASNGVTVAGAGSVWSNQTTLTVGWRESYAHQVVASNGGAVYVGGNVIVGNAQSNFFNRILVSGAGSVFDLSTNATISVGSGQIGMGNQVVVTNGGFLRGGGVVLGIGEFNSNNFLLVSGPGSLAQLPYGVSAGTNNTGILGSATPKGLGFALVNDGGTLEANVLVAGKSGSGTIANNGGVFQFTVDAPTINPNTPGAISVVDGTVAFRGVGNAAVLGQITNAAYSGANALRLDASTNASAASYALGAGNPFSRLEMVNGGTLWQGGALTVGEGASMLVSNSAAVVSAEFTNLGSVRVVNGTLSFSQPITLSSNASITLVHATNAFVGGLVVASNAFYGGSGRVESGPGATSFGTISPGNSPGTLAFSSNLTLLESSLLVLEIGGTNSADYDHLLVEGVLTKGGSVLVTNLGYAFLGGETFDFVDAAALAGSFAALSLPTLAGGMSWDTSLFESQGVLGVIAIPEPTAALALAAGLAALALGRRRKA